MRLRLASSLSLIAVSVSALLNTALAQTTITGTVIDATTKTPVPYATVAVGSQATSKLLNGTTTLDDGTFALTCDSPNVYIEVSFIGYNKLRMEALTLQGRKLELGTIMLEQMAETLQDVEIRGEKSTVEYKLDKRVFNVGKDLSSTGAGALEVLNNVPSVDVNIEGEVSLRGNAGVQILINGKPSVLADEGSNALGSITADMIDRVEVITNPSAKYEAAGTAGIINIVLKKEDKKGTNGSISINTGYPANHSVGISLNRRTEHFNFFTQFGAGYRSLPRYLRSTNENYNDSTLLESEGTEYRNEQFYNITLGTDYHLNDYNVITLAGSFALELEQQPSATEFSLSQIGSLSDARWERTEETSAVNPKYQYDLQYSRQFRNNKDHVLLLSTLGNFFGKEQSSEFTNTTLLGNIDPASQQTETNFFRADYTFKADYTNPISEAFTLEAGAQYEINDIGNTYAVFNLEDEVWVPDSGLTNDFQYDQKVLGVYTTAALEKERWGLKVGLRVENTDLQTVLVTTNEVNNQNYTNLFPTLHTSYKISDFASVQAGYSRRVRRPHLWDLNPFFNIRNNFVVRRGNPQLLPEFADSYEVSGVFVTKKASFSTSVYHLYTTAVIERVTVLEDNVAVTLPMNIGTNNKTGLEVTGKYAPAKWLSFNGDVNYGFFAREGTFNQQDFSFKGDQWSSKLTGKFKLPHKFDLELTGNWRSGFKTVQGREQGFVFANAGLRKKLKDGKWIANLSVRDIFASRINRSYVETSDYYFFDYGLRGRFITLGVSYSFGKGEAMTYSGRRH